MAKTIADLRKAQREMRGRRLARKEGNIEGLLFVRARVMKAEGMTPDTAHSLAKIIDKRIAELQGAEVV